MVKYTIKGMKISVLRVLCMRMRGTEEGSNLKKRLLGFNIIDQSFL